MELLNDKVIKRFFAKVDIPEENLFACWEWRGGKDPQGYGRIGINQKPYKCNRISYLIWNKKFPNNFACHTCDNPSCVNPLHLWDGTNYENVRDMVAKGRHKEGHLQERASLTKEQVKEIIDTYSPDRTYKRKGEITFTEIAKLYGVNRKTIYRVLKRETYKNI